jgi:hypothetical protein
MHKVAIIFAHARICSNTQQAENEGEAVINYPQMQEILTFALIIALILLTFWAWNQYHNRK